MARHRSPNYPQLTLREALERVRRVYAAEHTHAAAKEVIVQDLGYSGLNGASAVVIGALNRYELLESSGDGLKVSELAVAALELQEGDPDHTAAIRDLSLMPTLFSELNRQFGNQLPSEASLRHSLIKQGFLPKAAEDVIRIYRDNMELVGAASSEYNEAMQTPNVRSELRSSNEPAKHPSTWATATLAPRAGGPQFHDIIGQPTPQNELTFRLPHGSSAHIVFSGDVTREAIQKLIKLLELSEDAFPSAHEKSLTVDAAPEE